MKKFKFSILLLCLCMLLPIIVACGETENPTQNSDDIYYYDDSSRERAADSIPDDYDMENQSIGIFHTPARANDICGISDTTDIVYSRIHERNLSVEDRLNVDLEFMSSNTSSWQDASDMIKREIQTLSAAWDIVFTSNNSVIQMKLFNYFHNANETNYIDIEERWWYTDAITELSVDNYNCRFLYGDIAIGALGSAGAIYYNKPLYEQYISADKNPDEPYQLVMDGKWTFETLSSMVKKSRIEKGGDGTNDIYGYIYDNKEALHHFREGVGIHLYERNDQGMPVYNLNNDKSVDFANALYEFIYENDGALLDIPSEYTNGFTNGKAMFDLKRIGHVLQSNMREMKDDFGILPFPKWDEAQEEYITLAHNSATTCCIPISVDIDKANEEVSAVVEALASESYRKVTVAYYETALKAAYNRDDLSAQMIDIITGQHDTVKSTFTSNFVYEYSSSLGKLGGIFSTLINNQSNTFMSQYDSIIGSAETGMKDLIKQYKDGKI